MSLPPIEPLIIGLFCGKWLLKMKTRHHMGLRHPLDVQPSWHTQTHKSLLINHYSWVQSTHTHTNSRAAMVRGAGSSGRNRLTLQLDAFRAQVEYVVSSVFAFVYVYLLSWLWFYCSVCVFAVIYVSLLSCMSLCFQCCVFAVVYLSLLSSMCLCCRVRPPLWIMQTYLRAGSAEMPLRNWYPAGTHNFHPTDFYRAEMKKPTMLSNKSSTAWSCAENQILEN